MARLSGVDLRKWYGQREVVRGVSPEVNQGEIVGLLGPNGAGKTTSFYMLTGIIKPSSGRVLLEDQDIGTWPLHERARGILYLPQESSVFRKLTGASKSSDYSGAYGPFPCKEQKERADVLLEDFGLT
ncbi:MAG: ATP-binding cassette domain-containing protein [Bilophila wadsworthia]